MSMQSVYFNDLLYPQEQGQDYEDHITYSRWCWKVASHTDKRKAITKRQRLLKNKWSGNDFWGVRRFFRFLIEANLYNSKGECIVRPRTNERLDTLTLFCVNASNDLKIKLLSVYYWETPRAFKKYNLTLLWRNMSLHVLLIVDKKINFIQIASNNAPLLQQVISNFKKLHWNILRAFFRGDWRDQSITMWVTRRGKELSRGRSLLLERSFGQNVVECDWGVWDTTFGQYELVEEHSKSLWSRKATFWRNKRNAESLESVASYIKSMLCHIFSNNQRYFLFSANQNRIQVDSFRDRRKDEDNLRPLAIYK